MRCVIQDCDVCGAQNVPTIEAPSPRHIADGSVWICESCDGQPFSDYDLETEDD